MDHYQAWRAGKVNRMHTMPQLIRENTAEHTWGILIAVLRYYPQASADFLKAVIAHDAGEPATGDIPAHIKWADPKLAEILEQKEEDHVTSVLGYSCPKLDRREGMLLVIFDKLDFCMSCIHEMRMGNLNSAKYFGRSYDKAWEITRQYDINDETDREFRAVAQKFLDAVIESKELYLQHILPEEYNRGR
jgi:5'-deoxynucleotidase YfbR-like HD superfamily hydrolase